VTNGASSQYVSIPTAGVSYAEFLQGLSPHSTFTTVVGLVAIREQWLYYVEQGDAVVCVIDRSNKNRMGRVRAEIADVIKKMQSERNPSSHSCQQD
jgi:hypothetical protein